jgi:hypothetical protein
MTVTKRHEPPPVVIEDPAAGVQDDAASAEAASSEALVEASDVSFGEVYARLADSVTVAGANPPGTLSPDLWAEGPAQDDLEEEELEKEAAALEEQEGVDDPVRMYLREIGRVYLLSGDDEKRLARKMEEAKHLDAIEKQWLEEHGRAPSGYEILFTLIQQYSDAQKCVRFISKEIGIKASLISDVIQNEQWRSTVDADMDFVLADRPRSTCATSRRKRRAQSCASLSSPTSSAPSTSRP